MSLELGDHEHARDEHAAFWNGAEPFLDHDMLFILNLVNLGEDSRAAARFELALETEQRLGAQPWMAYTLRDQAAFFERIGQGRKAIAAAERGREIARTLGMPQLA